MTTPESLFLMLGSSARDTLATVDTIIVDEIHVMAASKRGVRLVSLAPRGAPAAAVEPMLRIHRPAILTETESYAVA